MANVPVIIRPDNHTKQINLTSNQRRRMATILLTNIIRLDRFQQKWTEENLIDDDNQDGMGKQKNQLDSWYECRLSSEFFSPLLFLFVYIDESVEKKKYVPIERKSIIFHQNKCKFHHHPYRK